jgi:hypothetical protein
LGRIELKGAAITVILFDSRFAHFTIIMTAETNESCSFLSLEVDLTLVDSSFDSPLRNLAHGTHTMNIQQIYLVRPQPLLTYVKLVQKIFSITSPQLSSNEEFLPVILQE